MAEAPLYSKLSVVVTKPPDQITFYADDPASYKQDIIIYNQYDIPLCFHVLVLPSDSLKYSLNIQKGCIKAKHYASVTLQHNAVTRANIGVTDKLRVKLYCNRPSRESVKKELLITLLSSREPSYGPNPFVRSSPESSAHHQAETRCKTCMQPYPTSSKPVERDQDDGTLKTIKNIMIGIVIGVICSVWYGYSRS